MPELRLYNRPVESIFSLLGGKENSITFSLGYALSKSPHFLQAFLHKVLHRTIAIDPAVWIIRLQQFQKKSGITDIEILGPDIHVIVEAKRGWNLPRLQQLELYVPRFSGTDATPLIVAMSECSRAYAGEHLEGTVKNIPVCHVNWSEASALSHIRSGSHAEKRLMLELRNYLATIVSMQNQDSNWVYVVSLGNQEWAPGLNFKQVVNERRRYFHPFGRGGWPKDAPNYLGFRYDGILQSVHHVEKAEIIKNFHPYFPEYANRNVDPTCLYQLGPAIRPPQQVRGGKVVRNMRIWAMLDLLLTSKTLSEARDKSNKRSSEF